MFKQPMAGGTNHEQALNETKQRDPARRANGVANLGVFGNAESVKVVKGFLQDEHENVRVAANYALLLLGQTESIPKLIEYLGHEKHEFRKRAAVALQTASGAGISCDHEDAEGCKKAAKEYEAWFKKAGGSLKWDAKKKTFEGAGKAKK